MSEFPVVTSDDHGIRPAGKPDACFYCGSKVGERHGPDCAVVVKRVRVRYSFEFDISVPHHWTKETVEFHRNESSWCASNAIDELAKEFPEDGPCPCDGFRCEMMGVSDDTPRMAS
jgi:hypothetical protein